MSKTLTEVHDFLHKYADCFRVRWHDGGEYSGLNGWEYKTYAEAVKCYQEQSKVFPDVSLEAVLTLKNFKKQGD